MEYPKGSANGDAGEYLAAYTLTKVLGWPCRLYGVDLGVDAELEILDATGVSHGDIIKVQIKAMTPDVGSRALAIYVDDRHIDYWKRFCLPVIVCCVDLSTERVYWKQITATEAFRSKGVSRKVAFDRDADLVSFATKPTLEKLVHPVESKDIESLFDELEARYAELRRGPFELNDLDVIVDVSGRCDSVIAVLERLERVLAFFPWRISTFAHARMLEISVDTRSVKGQCDMVASGLLNGD